MDINNWNQKIRDTIEKCAYEFYLIHPIKEIKCRCIDHATKQADPGCKLCLGTGCKIKIKKIKGAANDIEANAAGKGIRGSSATTVAKTYFIDSKYRVEDTDIIIDEDEILYVFRIYTMKGLKGEITHNQVTAYPLKNDHKTILNNFREIMRRYGGKK